MRTEHLDFITFCVGSLSDALDKSASQVYGALRSSGVLNDYILPCYDVLHTFSKDYFVEELPNCNSYLEMNAIHGIENQLCGESED